MMIHEHAGWRAVVRARAEDRAKADQEKCRGQGPLANCIMGGREAEANSKCGPAVREMSARHGYHFVLAAIGHIPRVKELEEDRCWHELPALTARPEEKNQHRTRSKMVAHLCTCTGGRYAGLCFALRSKHGGGNDAPD